MWQKELNAAISNKQTVTVCLRNGEVIQGIPERCTDRIKLRKANGVVWVPLTDIQHVSRLIQFIDSRKDRYKWGEEDIIITKRP